MPHLKAPGARLLLIFWALAIPLVAERVGVLALQYPLQRATALRLLEPLLAPEQPDTPTPPAPATGPQRGVAIELCDVAVHAAGTPVLGDISLTISPGEHVALVGASGAGKSTICALLLGWATPSAGTLTVDGRALDHDALQALCAQTAWLDPGVRLWNRSLADNVLYGQPGADSDHLHAALAAAELGGVGACLHESGEALGPSCTCWRSWAATGCCWAPGC